ncbi:hypothetical protein D9M72_616370 [compost metagenome]
MAGVFHAVVVSWQAIECNKGAILPSHPFHLGAWSSSLASRAKAGVHCGFLLLLHNLIDQIRRRISFAETPSRPNAHDGSVET